MSDGNGDGDRDTDGDANFLMLLSPLFSRPPWSVADLKKSPATSQSLPGPDSLSVSPCACLLTSRLPPPPTPIPSMFPLYLSPIYFPHFPHFSPFPFPTPPFQIPIISHLLSITHQLQFPPANIYFSGATNPKTRQHPARRNKSICHASPVTWTPS